MDRSALLSAADFCINGRTGWMVLVQVSLDDPQVAGVRPEKEVWHRTDERDQPEHPVDTDIPGHARDVPLRHAEIARFPCEVGAKRGGGGRADARHEV